MTMTRKGWGEKGERRGWGKNNNKL